MLATWLSNGRINTPVGFEIEQPAINKDTSAVLD
jgi:hypothetical protein